MNRDEFCKTDELHEALTQYEIDREHSGSDAPTSADADANGHTPRIVFDAADNDPREQQAVLRAAGWTLLIAVFPLSAYFVAGVYAVPNWPPALLAIPIVLLGIGCTVLAFEHRMAVDSDPASESPPDDRERSKQNVEGSNDV